MNPEISIIIPIYNVEQYLKRCIDSILNQSFKNFELILVDDGSTDNSGKIIDEYESIDKRIRVIHKENGGQGSARNRGLDIAKGNYIGFVDSDDWIHRDMYKCMYKFITKDNTDIVQVNHNIVTEYISDEKCNLDDIKSTNIDDIIRKFTNCNSFEILPFIFTVNKLYKRDIWKDLRFSEGKFAEDLRIIYKVYFNISKFKIIDFKFYNYYMSCNSSTRGEFNIKKLEDIEAWEEMFKFINENNISVNKCNLKVIYCRRILAYYFKCYKYKGIQKELKRKFNDNFRYILRNKKLNYKEKSVYVFFFINPKICKFIYKNKLSL
ncbi:glycosyltransferase family 2 protein [Clostridium saudiense]|uniref:glycosyltransferase family 2 protein n=1 Tax=Clostridium saudiense TaxID=1414720 RepID=UPI0018AA33FB|nr:glycosyltransferase [Clostridium saudiense]